MSTRSLIARKREDGKYEGIYCHSDGYLTYNGALLLDYYNNNHRIKNLIKMGDMSCLEPFIRPNGEHSFDYDKREPNVCVFYGRDRGEKDTEPRVCDTIYDLICSQWDAEYIYVFENNTWYYWDFPIDEEVNKDMTIKDLRKVEEDLEEEYNNYGIKERPLEYYGYLSEDIIENRIKKLL